MSQNDVQPEPALASRDVSGQSPDRSKEAMSIAGGIVGILMFLLGAVLAIKWGTTNWDKARAAWVLGLLIGGNILFVGVLLWNRGAEHANVVVRRALYGYNVFFTLALLAGTLVIVNVLVAQYGPPHLDWTSQGTFTLAPQSKSVAQSLEKPVRFIAVYRRGGPTQRQLEQLFELYKHESNLVSYEFVDRVEDKIRSEELFKQYPDAKMAEEVVIVTYGSGENPEHHVVKDSEILSASAAVRGFNIEEAETQFNGEAAITAAIIQLTDERKSNVYFTTGHGELDPNNSEDRGESALEGIGVVKEAMTALNMKVETIDLAQKEIPSDADLVIIAGPKTGFESAEVQKLRDFMDRRDKSGNKDSHMIVMLDPVVDMRKGAPQDAGLGDLLASFQVQPKDNLVLQRASVFQGSMAAPLVPIGEGSRAPSHAILKGLSGERVLMLHAREISPVASSGAPMPGELPKPYQATTLISTIAGTDPFDGEALSWGEGSYDVKGVPRPGGANDTPGPVSLAVAVSEEEGPPQPPPSPFAPQQPPKRGKSNARLVVFGDSAFASNYIAGRIAPANYDLFMNTVNWLRGRLELVDIAPRTKKNMKLSIEDKYYKMLFLPTGLMFGLFVSVAGAVWIVRHRF